MVLCYRETNDSLPQAQALYEARFGRRPSTRVPGHSRGTGTGRIWVFNPPEHHYGRPRFDPDFEEDKSSICSNLERFNTMSKTNFVFMQAVCILRKEDGTWNLTPPERVVKLKSPDHLEACTQQKNHVRKVNSISCDNDVVQLVMSNYLIAEKILSYLSWQDHLACEGLSSTWRLAVKNLRRNTTMGSIFLVVDQCHWQVKAKSTNSFFNEPMAVLTFCDQKKFGRYVHYSTAACKNIVPSPCQPPCKERHVLMDYLQHQLCGPKSCMLTVFALRVSSPHFLSGVYIPSIPDVEFRVMKMNSRKDIQSKIQQLAETHIFKGALVYQYTSEYYNDIIEYFKNVQPEIPFAIGGGCVHNTICEQGDIDEMINLAKENLTPSCMFHVTIGLFCVRKNASNTDESTNKHNFDMFSLVIKKKGDKEQAVKEFADKIPHFEHSVGVKLSDDESRDEINEERYFQAAFPNTTLVGCRSCYLVGLNHPALPEAASHMRRMISGSEDKYYKPSNYCTAFVYIGWGKIVKQAAQPSGSNSTC